ncbi:uncharacterized protein CC84DRAFT_608671 [Paraphaeosphaeria sporulosa]|uniref:Uncharacterized protein n=1 Tax=Paraphaeosphaeria sporulosa TaxID=1460663 RepID=A0A177BVV5_9PLEO|nr:uncharacterized protein CC84DRAFT_608671 [Paraphaeosphaeria sporulosa]OAF98459.1 hypothetical protein CC84DRAFT_608671 [Paraphaeosphaeria sporulosa]
MPGDFDENTSVPDGYMRSPSSVPLADREIAIMGPKLSLIPMRMPDESLLIASHIRWDS